MLTANLISRALAFAAAIACLALPGNLNAQAQPSPLNQRVLVVYNAADVNSTAVANYYAASRSIPATNLCAINPSSTTILTWTAFVSTVKTPVQNCLATLGSSNILYIVFTYNTPYDLIAPDQNTYSLDQYVADIWDLYEPAGLYGIPLSPHPYFAASQPEGNVFVPFSSMATFRSQNSTLIYSVWRLDAATPALARGLVDKAIAAETAGLKGQACIDEMDPNTPYDYGDGITEWDLRKAAAFSKLAGFSVTEDSNLQEFGSAPAPLTCNNAALYSGWYSYDNYNNVFSWNTGAIGFHIDSASAVNPRGGSNWSANALINGITITHGSVSEPYVTGFAHSGGVFRNLLEGSNVGDAFLRNTAYLKWMMLNIGDPLYRPFPVGSPAVTAPANSLLLTPQYLFGGSASIGTITLATAAASDTVFTLTSDRTSVATAPASVTVPAGQTTASFPISTNFVADSTPLLITAASSTITLSNTLVPTTVLGALTINPSTLAGGTSAVGTVYLNANAPNGGITVGLSSNSSAASVPATVTVPAGMSAATFTVSTSIVSANSPSIISASYAGTMQDLLITVTPAPVVPPVISMVTASATSTGATVTWTTDQASNSQVAYGTTAGYGSLSALSSTLVTAHSVTLNGLTASTTYHYQVQSQAAQGGLATSADMTFATAASPAGPTLLQIMGNQTEVSGVTNGSVVTPSVAPAGFTGSVIAKGTGSVNYTAAQTGNGVYFENCCANTNTAYYKFTGAAVGNIFNMSEGQVTFYLQSRYSFAQRVASASLARYTFDVRDGNGQHLFYFLTQISGGYLYFNYGIAGTAQYTWLAHGTEDAMFGNGVILQVQMTWSGGVTNLYLNGKLVRSAPAASATANWTSGSLFDLGAYEYLTFGGYDSSDDVIDGFTVSGPASGPNTTPPVVAMTAPSNGSSVGGMVAVSASATDPAGVTGVQFQLDGVNLGSVVTVGGPSYTYSWNTTAVANGLHTLTAVAADTAGNTASSGVSVVVSNTIAPPVISGVTAGSVTATGVVITWTTDQASNSQVAYGTTASYGSLSALSSTLVTAHSVTLNGLTSSTTYHYQVQSQAAQGGLATSADMTFVTAAAPAGPTPLLQLMGNQTEVSGVTNGSVVTPSVAPAGFTGSVIAKGTGSVNYTAAQTGNGVYFENCCANTNTAYYKFTGAAVGNIFNMSEGQVTFYLQSRYSFAQRVASASLARYTFDVRDGNGQHLFYFLTQISGGYLYFNYGIAGTAQYTWLAHGTEDAMFGNGVILQVQMTWSGGVTNLYLNGKLVRSAPAASATANWTSGSLFDLGAYEYLTFGGYDSSDDVINGFTVFPTPQ